MDIRNAVLQAVVFLFFIALESTAQNNVGPCTCDLTQSACDVNCCCDADCSDADTLAFSSCVNDYSFSNTQSCFPTSIMFRNDTPYVINVSSGSGLSCIYYDSFTARNYYTNPQVENSNVTKVSLKAFSFSSYNLTAVMPATGLSSYSSIYKAGDRILTVYNVTDSPSYLYQPSALIGSESCGYWSPALFLADGASSCNRVVTSTSCETDPAINLSGFIGDFRIVPQPSFINENATVGLNYTALTPLTPGEVTCLVNGTAVACADVVPSLSGSVCSNVLTTLTYKIKYQQSSGIYEVSYDATLAPYDVNNAYSLRQTFTVAFNVSSSASTPSPRSGNPGYLPSKPVLAGRRNATNGVISVNSDPRQWLTVPGALGDSSGACNDAASAAISIGYGEDLLASCSRQLTLTGGALSVNACSDASSTVRASLDGLGIFGDKVVGKFGDSLASVTSGWLQILVDSATCTSGSVQQTSTGCVNTILGGRLDLLVAKTGSVTNPQNSIVGGRLQCVRGNVTFQCSAGACSSGNFIQNYMTSYSVNFIDTSSTPTSNSTSTKSVFEMRLVKNFFYLLYVENGAGPSASPAPSTLSAAFCLMGVFYWVSH